MKRVTGDELFSGESSNLCSDDLLFIVEKMGDYNKLQQMINRFKECVQSSFYAIRPRLLTPRPSISARETFDGTVKVTATVRVSPDMRRACEVVVTEEAICLSDPESLGRVVAESLDESFKEEGL